MSLESLCFLFFMILVLAIASSYALNPICF
jgi:hypothetical protein